MQTNVAGRVADFIRSKKPPRPDNGYCDDCIGHELGLSSGRIRVRAHHITSSLAHAPKEFDRGRRPCDGCGKVKLVIRAV